MIEQRDDFHITINKKGRAYDQIQKQIQATNKNKGYLVVYYNDDNGTEESVVFPVPKGEKRIKKLLVNQERLEERKKEKEETTVGDFGPSDLSVTAKSNRRYLSTCSRAKQSVVYRRFAHLNIDFDYIISNSSFVFLFHIFQLGNYIVIISLKYNFF